MRIHLSPRDIRQGYKGIKRLAWQSFRNGETERALDYIHHCVVIAQQFNWIYCDDELEELMCEIGETVLPSSVDHFESVPGRVVFYDDFCTSFVLALQYLRALVAEGKEILYITPRRYEERSRFATILDEIGTYDKVHIHIVPKTGRLAKIQDIYRAIIDFAPEKLLLHMEAFSIAIPPLYHLPEAINRYIINLADQTYWLGKKGIDYSLEFRPFGASVSIQRRGLRKEQLLMVPFYPIVDNNPFLGFPAQCSDYRIVIFSGGDLYKVIDGKKRFWNLVKRILDSHPDVVFLFATKVNRQGTKMIDEFIKNNGYQDRFIYIGFRKDINEVFKHCDIYMGTCPASGSLMSQLAAFNSKPILQFYEPGTPDDETEQAICINESFPISFSDERAFIEEADRLITDSTYRKQQGDRLRPAMMQPDQFDGLLIRTLEENRTQLPIVPSSIDYSFLDERWFALEKMHYIDTLPYIYGLLGKKNALRFAPGLFVKNRLNKLFRK